MLWNIVFIAFFLDNLVFWNSYATLLVLYRQIHHLRLYTKTKAHLHFQFVVFKSCESCFVINEQPWVSNVYSKICIFYYVNIFTVCDVNRKWYCNGAEFATVTGTYQLEVRHKEVHYNSKEIFLEVSASLTLYDITNLNSHFVYHRFCQKWACSAFAQLESLKYMRYSYHVRKWLISMIKFFFNVGPFYL